MRLLSRRWQCLSKPTSTATQIRHASGRYSVPARREASTSHAYGNVSEQSPARSELRNPLDVRAAQLQWEEKRQYHLRRMRVAGMGLLLTLGALTMIIFNLDLDQMEQSEHQRKRGQQLDASSESTANFQGKEVHVIGIGDSKRIVAQGAGEEIELVETGTSSVPHFPRTIYLPSSEPATPAAPTDLVGSARPNAAGNPGNIGNKEEYSLVGLGIRTVMWIQVYVVGMYVRTQDLNSLQAKLIKRVNPTASALIPSEKEDLKKQLLDPEKSREIWAEVLKVPGVKTAFRISPTRGTDFGHLRDGFVSGINTRTSETRRLTQGGVTEYDSEDFGQSVQQLKGIFAGGKAPKGSILILARDDKGVLDVLYQPKPDQNTAMQRLGSVADERVSRLLWFGYLAGAKVSSQGAREGIVDGCMEIVARPIGTAAAMVH